MKEMTDEEIVASFQQAGALLTGHFQLRSKKHSNRFVQAALVFRDPLLGERLCQTSYLRETRNK